MVSVQRLRRCTRRSSKDSAEKTPIRASSSPISSPIPPIPPISSPIPPIPQNSSPFQPNFAPRAPIHQIPQFDFMDSHYSPYAL
ncbi:unnamed protein product [Arabidopsis lyrata]|nr:unnamed protein product [Arabidopsis lyrata]